jgi:hypothetical protein
MRLFWLALLWGCNGDGSDADGDGTADDADCAPEDPASYPGAPEVCDGADQNCDGSVDEIFDLDGDGYLADEASCRALGGPVDCDDTRDSVHPGADELCDGVDNDCSGFVDDDADGDQDGYFACEDCDDADAFVFPSAMDACDGVDNDCNGLVDEAWDEDGDGESPCAGDCDDRDPTNSTNQPEVCDGHDNNCDGASDEGFDVDADLYTTCQGDCDDTRADVHPGALEICDTVDTDCDGIVQDDTDVDLDGYTICTGDCAEDVAEAFPGGVEVCDDEDNDCNGVTDEISSCYQCSAQDPYLYCKKDANWTEAQVLCQSWGGDLTTLLDETEYEEVTGAAWRVASWNAWWIGLTDVVTEGAFLWTDGTEITYDSWGWGEPSDNDSRENCASVNGNGQHDLADDNCTEQASFICELPTP